MTSRRLSLAVVFSLVVGLIALAASPRDPLWKEVDEAVSKGLPQTAIEKLQPIIDGAIKDKQYAEAIKAIGRKVALEGNIQGNKPEEKITRMRAEIDKAPDEMKPVMEAILANWYWHYFQQNRWRFMQRTQTAAAPGEDFTTWDLTRIFSEIDKQFRKALASAEVLQKTPVADYDALLEKGNAPDGYRPTLYDFLVYNALEFYAAGEQAGAQPEDAFDIPAGSPILGTIDEFIAWQPVTEDETSSKLQAIRLYQDLLKFHLKDEDKSAPLDTDLNRLTYANNTAFGEEKQARYMAALKRFASENAKHELSSRALHDLAMQVYGKGEYVESLKICEEGLARFPESVGGRRCYNLIQQIKAKELNITTERVWNKPWPTIDVRYRNITKIYFRLVTYNFEDFVKSKRWSPEQLDQGMREMLLKQEPARAWSADLPATADYKQRLEQLALPEELKSGSYYLLASANEGFNENDNVVSFTEVWVSELAFVVRTHQGDGIIDGFVLHANSGEPIEGAKVRSWARNNNGDLTPAGETKTDKNGMFRFDGIANNGLILHAEHDGQNLSSVNYFYNNKYDYNAKPYEMTMFFTDRALYRPGQSIHYKGIAMAINQAGDNYETIRGRTLTVVFNDVNGKEIEKHETKTNDYGSFSGTFTAPRDRLMGMMNIQVAGNPPGATQVQVEEYKRPKFQVSLDAPKEAARLNDTVKLQGKATSYTGAAIDGAKVRWRVVRQVRYPMWWYWRCWWMPPAPGGNQEIAHGTAMTETNGTFPIEFIAKPDETVSPESEPTFQFTIYADVIDTTGETRSAQRVVNVGYTALAATLTAADWQVDDKPVSITVSTTTLDGEGQKAEGVLKVYALKQPQQVVRLPLGGNQYYFYEARASKGGAGAITPSSDPTNPNSWPLGDVVYEEGVTTEANGKKTVEVKLATGMYRAKFETKDRFGKAVNAELPIRVLDPDAGKLKLKITEMFVAPKWSLEPGEELLAIWGSGYDKARAYIEIEHRGQLLKNFWTEPGATQFAIKEKITEAMRGGFTVRVTMVRENRAYLHSNHVDVPWTNKVLTVKWEHFVSKLSPAQKETWTAVVSGPDAKHAVAEMVAGMYDASLDAYKPFGWPGSFNVFRQDHSRVTMQFENTLKGMQYLTHTWRMDQKDGSLSYRHFPYDIIGNFWGYEFGGKGRGNRLMAGAPMAARASERQLSAQDALASNGLAEKKAGFDEQAKRDGNADRKAFANDKSGGGEGPEPDLSNVSARKNLNETAFFFPHLIASEDGTVKMEFTMPEALTEWKFQAFAHDNQLRGGLMTDKVVTAKDLMIQPNPPRFLREGDLIEFTVKVSNQSPTIQKGKVRLTFADARTSTSVDDKLKNAGKDQAFEIPAGESRTVSWKIAVPDDMGLLTYKAIGSTGKLSDGEQGFLPVLSRRIMVTESLPLPIRNKGTKKFEFEKLLASGKSDSLKSKTLTVQMVSNPSWYAVMALPYLMEYPYECTEQTFNRLYANALARHIAASDPKIHHVFEQWRGTKALDSPLEKNQDLKSVVLEETPWVRQADAESQARRNVGILFEDNRLNEETARLMQKLTEQQLGDGMWPWFPGGRGNEYITLYITTGFGRLRHLGVKLDMAPAIKSLTRLDAWADQMYRDILKAGHKDENHLSTTIAFYLYGRSFFLEDQVIAAEHKESNDYWLGQAKTHWLKLDNRQSQAHLSLALKRFGDKESAQGIMASIKERSVSNEEMGMFWRDLELSWWWYRAPIETQAMMIEAFDEVMNDQQSVEDCKVWLLKQKQTQDWKTTKATADAVYALLLRGSDLLASDELVEVSLGGETIKPENVEAGTGFYEERFQGGDIKPKQGEISVTKVDDGVAWGSIHWQYLEDMSKITPHEGTPLKLTKEIYTKVNTKKGPTLTKVAGPVEVGDELVVRIVLRTDRDMEYVHLKDYRGSGTEPVNVLSQYKYQDGLAYYESTRDTASHFFIDYLPKGTYVFEYSTRVQLKGKYQTGIAQIECMYAPEFNSHSESLPLEVK